MAKCDACGQDMLESNGCIVQSYDDFKDGILRDRIPHPADAAGRCGDCNCLPGKLHHPGCDQEVCPACGGQALSCDCGDSDSADGEPARTEAGQFFRLDFLESNDDNYHCKGFVQLDLHEGNFPAWSEHIKRMAGSAFYDGAGQFNGCGVDLERMTFDVENIAELIAKWDGEPLQWDRLLAHVRMTDWNGAIMPVIQFEVEVGGCNATNIRARTAEIPLLWIHAGGIPSDFEPEVAGWRDSEKPVPSVRVED